MKMKVSFSTLAVPDWSLPQVLDMASKAGYDGVELRFLEGQDALWKVPGLSGSYQTIHDRGLMISCVDTSCRFHFPDKSERAKSLEEGKRMVDLAAALHAPGVRIFGDKVQPGADRAATVGWIAEGMWALADYARPKNVEVWIETHGDFANAKGTLEILNKCGCHDIGAVWDPGNCIDAVGEKPAEGARVLGHAIRHVHFKDLQQNEKGEWKPVLTGQGKFPLLEALNALKRLDYDRFVSFEWEKKWNPDIPDGTVALPQFMDWWRTNWERAAASFRSDEDAPVSASPDSPFWKDVSGFAADNDNYGKPVPGHHTEIRSRWTRQNLYLLFICHYEKLYPKPNPNTAQETYKLWDWDVAEAFLGSDFANIKRYREFEVSPQGEWVDLDIDLGSPHHEDGWKWNSGFHVATKVDSANRVWYAEMQIPWKSLKDAPPAAGQELRANFYRAQGPPPNRRQIAWQPTNTATFHTPQAFGTLKLVG